MVEDNFLVSDAVEAPALFARIPANLFSVLAGPLRALHSDLLLLAYQQYRRTIHTLPRETIIDLYCEYLESLADSSWIEAAEAEDEDHPDSGGVPPMRSVRERAAHFLRKLVEAGWMVQEPHFDYTFRLSFPDYALQLLEAMERIRTGYRMEYRARVLAIYQNLTGQEGMTYVALQQSSEDTASFIDGLKQLNHSIKHYTERLLCESDAQGILSQVFDEYCQDILGQQYYRLKTSEHISKYRTGILKQVRQWESNRAEIRSQGRAMVQEAQAEDETQAENQIYAWLHFIDESFRHMDELLNEIDQRNMQYARSAVERLQFRLQYGRGLKDQLATVMGYLAELAKTQGEQSQTPEAVNRIAALFPQRALDESCVRHPVSESHIHQPQPVQVERASAAVRQRRLQQFRKRVREEVTIAEVNAYVKELLQGRTSLSLAEVPLHSDRDWLWLIYLVAYSSTRRACYELTGQRGASIAINDGQITIPKRDLVLKPAAAEEG